MIFPASTTAPDPSFKTPFWQFPHHGKGQSGNPVQRRKAFSISDFVARARYRPTQMAKSDAAAGYDGIEIFRPLLA